jgi:flagellar protein FliJ
LRQFTYSLETLLRHRKQIEEREREKLHRLNYQHQVESNIRKELASRLQETMKDLAAMCADKSRDKELTWFRLYLNRLTREISKSDMGLARLKDAVAAQKDVVMEASKSQKILASMKAKKEKEFFLEMGRQEQKEIDDLVVTQYSKADARDEVSAEVHDWKNAAKKELA